MSKIGIAWAVDSESGWGVFGTNFVLELLRMGKQPVLVGAALGDVVLSPERQRLFSKVLDVTDSVKKMRKAHPENLPPVNFPVFCPSGNSFQSFVPVISMQENRLIIFFENTWMPQEAVESSKIFSRIYAGSTWNADILKSKGFENVQAWAQGIDFSVFYPKEQIRKDEKFRIFTGGKLEFRKGQDLVIAAFKLFHEKYPNSELVVKWTSPWPQVSQDMSRSSWVKVPKLDGQGQLNTLEWLCSEGVEEGSVVDGGFTPNEYMADVMRSCDVGLFPNRAEGGTNLVAMECIACGVPTILSANTGHLDLTNRFDCYSLQEQAVVPSLGVEDGTEGWGESSIDEIVATLEEVYLNREQAKAKGTKAAEQIKIWNWETKIAELMEGL